MAFQQLAILQLASMTIRIHFLPDDVTVDAKAGEPLLQVAERAGVFIPTGCLMGSCHACEVEVEGKDTICACITAVPAGSEQLTINLYVDPAW
ncbi:2Fe-2S iron-sulfur cluster-binding protein [Trichocoleus sp. FACHB-69]|uniref:2Fe-2S iron-sulfur cluster-binding protein n=2 Tax=Cyanophyceae TaxID=3028117 RepID=UPI0037DD9317